MFQGADYIAGGLHAAGIDENSTGANFSYNYFHGTLQVQNLTTDADGYQTFTAGLGPSSGYNYPYDMNILNWQDFYGETYTFKGVANGSDTENIDFGLYAGEFPIFRITGNHTLYTYGRSSPFGGAFATDNLVLGFLNYGIRMTSRSAAPTTGDWAQGDVIYNLAPTSGGFVGWVCTAAGTPGTWLAFGNSVLENTATYDPPSLAAGAVDTIQTMTVTGAALGDLVDVSFSLDLQGITLRAWVSATNTVKYVFECAAGGATVDLGSGTVKCRIRK
jgi:hypothetical protein